MTLERLVDLEDDGQITQRLDALYGAHDSRLDPRLLAAQTEAVREQW